MKKIIVTYLLTGLLSASEIAYMHTQPWNYDGNFAGDGAVFVGVILLMWPLSVLWHILYYIGVFAYTLASL